MKISNNTTFDQSVALVFNNLSLLMKDLTTITQNLSMMMTYSCIFNNYTPRRQHRKRTNRSEAWLNRKRSNDSNLTTFSSGSNKKKGLNNVEVSNLIFSKKLINKSTHQKDLMTEMNQNTWSCSNEKLITNTASEGTIDSNTEVNSSDDKASIPKSNRFNLIHNINQLDSRTKSQKHESIAENNATSKVFNNKGSNIHSSRKTKAYTKKQSRKMIDEIKKDSKLKSTTDTNKSKHISSSRMNNPITQSTDAKSTSDTSNNEETFNSKESNNTIGDLNTINNNSSLTLRREAIQKEEIADENRIVNEVQNFVAKRIIGKSTKLKETISKALKNFTTKIDGAINIGKLFFPNEDYNELKIYIEEIKKQKQSFYFEFLNEKEIQICNSFYDSDYTTREELYFNV